MTDLAVSLSLYSSTSLNDAMRLSVSAAQHFFESKSFSDWKKNRESEMKLSTAVIDRLNTVIKAIGVLAKVFGGHR